MKLINTFFVYPYIYIYIYEVYEIYIASTISLETHYNWKINYLKY